MRSHKKRNAIAFIAFAIVLFSLTSCLTPQKLDKFVAAEYNNELPKRSNRKKVGIEVTHDSSTNNAYISTTVHKTDKFLPLLIYWKYDHRQSCSLNPSIPITNFSNAVNLVATKKLTDKLNGRRLELTVEEAPAAFSIVVKENMIWLVYAFTWARVYIEPDVKNLVVSYKLMEAETALKTGTIIVKNNDSNKGFRFFQSWQSATSEYLSEYNANFTNMAKSFVAQLTEEL